MNAIDHHFKPFAILRLIAGLDHAPTLAELTAMAREPKPTVHRWLAILGAAGLVQRTLDGRRFELGAGATGLALMLLANQPGSGLRHDILKRVVGELGESCNLTALQGTEVVYLDRVESAWPLRITFQPGSRVPAHCSASGKMFLALMPPARRARVLQGLALERFTDHTSTDPDLLGKELDAIRAQGYALDREEYMSGLVCVAVPIRGGTRRSPGCVAALALQAPVNRMAVAEAAGKVPVLRAAARAIEATLG